MSWPAIWAMWALASAVGCLVGLFVAWVYLAVRELG